MFIRPSMSTITLLFLLCFGAAEAVHLRYSGIVLKNSAKTIAQGFITEFQKNIINGDALSRRFSDNYYYESCNVNFNKAKAIAMLSQVPSGAAQFTMGFQSAEFVNGNDVQYTVISRGLERPDFEAQFILRQENGKYVLIGGKTPKCSVGHLLSRMDGSELIAKPFIKSMATIIVSKDQSKLAALFADNFLFHGCSGDYDKAKTLTLFSNFPSSSNISLTFKSSEWINDKAGIQYNVVADGFGRSAFEAQFILNQQNEVYVLTGGKIPVCPKRRLFSQWY